MKLQQLVGPFEKNSSISFSNLGAEYVHIGVQIPNRPPVSWKNDKNEWTSDGALSPDIQINNVNYSVNKNGILEFDGELASGQISLKFLKRFPANTIVDIIYKSASE